MQTLWVGTPASLELYLKQESEARPAASDVGVDLKAYTEGFDPLENIGEDGEPTVPHLTVTNGVGIIQIAGLLVADDSWFNEFMGRTSYGSIQRALMVAAARSDVHKILLDVISPGGTVVGARETMLMVKAIGKDKPIVSYSEMAASAAYWLVSATEKRYIAATGLGGSIGVVAKHTEYSKMNEKAGITDTILRAGQYKQLMNSSEPLTDTAVAETMRLLDESYRVFVQDIADNLGMPYAQIDVVAQGREYLGQQAVDAGLFHKVSDFQGVLSALVITEGEGGSIVNKKNKSLTYGMASAFAASAAGKETPLVVPAVPGVQAADAGGSQLAAEDGVKLDADGNPVTVVAEEPTKEEQLELDLEASVALVAERDATIVEAAAAAAESVTMVEAAAVTITELTTIVAQAVGNMATALNVENTLSDDADAKTVLAAYTEKSQMFATSFPTGGVAAVDAAVEEPVEEPLRSRMDAARGKQTVAPRR